MILSQDAYIRARISADAVARPLDAARFRFHFEGGRPGDVVDQLRTFQNPDGGFGHALEPDLRMAGSSALCTTVALQILREVDSIEGKELSTSAIQYLLQTYNPALRSWRIVPPSADEAPHAPWWTQAGGEERFNRFSLNPTAEILGYLIDHRELVPPDLISSLTEVVLKSLCEAATIEMHDLLCMKRLAETKELDGLVRGKIEGHLQHFLDTVVIRDSTQWGGYGLRPLQVADHPLSPFFSRMEDVINSNLDYEIGNQQPDGAWIPNWTWGGEHPGIWETARKEWAGVLTLERVLWLKRYGRIQQVV